MSGAIGNGHRLSVALPALSAVGFSRGVRSGSWNAVSVAFGDAVTVPADSSEAEWIAPTLGEFGTVGGVVPGGYEAYLLIDFRGPGEPAGWDGVQSLFGELAALLATETSTPNACAFAIWEGYGFATSATRVAWTGDDVDHEELARLRREAREADVARQREVIAALATVPKFELPNRRYYLVVGAAECASRTTRPDGPFPQPPDLWWPNDRRWFVGGDTDLDWCYLAGAQRLIDVVGATLVWRTQRVAWEMSNEDAGRIG